MKVIVKNISAPYTQPSDVSADKAVRRLRSVGANVKSCAVYRRSVDARHKKDIRFVYSFICECDNVNADKLSQIDAVEERAVGIEPLFGECRLDGRPLVCGFGPAGMFAALLLAEHGYRPIVIERGDDVYTRRAAVTRFLESGVLDTESNVQFGAGGAGTFSDGKLMTRVNDPRCRYVLERFCEFGAPSDILVRAKPHVGTDKLLCVVSNIEKRITALGGEVYYRTRLDGIIRKESRVSAVVTNRGEIKCGCLVLATGHSARDTYTYLLSSGISVQPKPISVGVRIEHLRSDIDRALDGDRAGDPLLGAAEYNLSAHINGTGVYSFCMCPGGTVIAAASEEGGVVTNGMSDYARDAVNSNSALAVSVECADPMLFQRKIERAAYHAGGGGYRAPIETVGDFLNDARTPTAPTRVMPSYMNGECRVCRLDDVLPSDICTVLRAGLRRFGRSIDGFDASDAVLTAAETRTSAPYRILRGDDLCAVGTVGLYPCGEGAGYAGGITSAALDGIRVALEIMKKYKVTAGETS